MGVLNISHLGLPDFAFSINLKTGLPQISETQILSYVRNLSEDIGFRTVGTAEHALADEWMIDKAHEVQKECQRLVEADPERNLECEVWHQRGSGAHRYVPDFIISVSILMRRRFDMMGKRLYKTYTELTNIVIRVSNGTLAGKEHAVLVNAHLDSTLPSPGAADDALSVGVMLECIRVLTHTPGWTPAHAIVFRKVSEQRISVPSPAKLFQCSIMQKNRSRMGPIYFPRSIL